MENAVGLVEGVLVPVLLVVVLVVEVPVLLVGMLLVTVPVLARGGAVAAVVLVLLVDVPLVLVCMLAVAVPLVFWPPTSAVAARRRCCMRSNPCKLGAAPPSPTRVIPCNKILAPPDIVAIHRRRGGVVFSVIP